MSDHPYMVEASSPGPKVCAACGREQGEPCDLYSDYPATDERGEET